MQGGKEDKGNAPATLDMPGAAASGAAAPSASGRSSSSDSDDMTRIIESMQREKDKEKKP
jgi:hypothetical protein